MSGPNHLKVHERMVTSGTNSPPAEMSTQW